MNSPRGEPEGLRRVLDGVRDLFVGDDAVDHALALHPIEDASLAVDVVILQVDERDPGIAEGRS